MFPEPSSSDGSSFRESYSDAFLPFGRFIDVDSQLWTAEPRFHSTETAFASASLFDAGADGEVDLLWVTYERADRPRSFEAHRLTEQALIPILGSVVQHVFRKDWNNGQIETFVVEPGQGIVMLKDCYHTTTSAGGRAVCLMVSRRSTTEDLATGLREDRPLIESHCIEVPGSRTGPD